MVDRVQVSVLFLGTDCPHVVDPNCWKSNINSIIVLCSGHILAIFVLCKGQIVIEKCSSEARKDIEKCKKRCRYFPKSMVLRVHFGRYRILLFLIMSNSP